MMKMSALLTWRWSKPPSVRMLPSHQRTNAAKPRQSARVPQTGLVGGRRSRYFTVAVDYSLREVAALLDVSPHALRDYARNGWIDTSRNDRGQFRVGFGELSRLRSLVEQLQERRALQHVLRGLKAHGGHAVVRDGELVRREGDVLWDMQAPQRRLDFVRDAPAVADVLAFSPRRRDTPHAASMLEAARAAVQAKEVGAPALYEAYLQEFPDDLAAMVELARELHAREELPRAAAWYRRIAEVTPDDPLAWFDLGIVLEDVGEATAAIAAYEQALAVDNSLADAHFNAARLYEKAGNRGAALRHLLSYRQLLNH